jgi:hypothetical protein
MMTEGGEVAVEKEKARRWKRGIVRRPATKCGFEMRELRVLRDVVGRRGRDRKEEETGMGTLNGMKELLAGRLREMG